MNGVVKVYVCGRGNIIIIREIAKNETTSNSVSTSSSSNNNNNNILGDEVNTNMHKQIEWGSSNSNSTTS